MKLLTLLALPALLLALAGTALLARHHAPPPTSPPPPPLAARCTPFRDGSCAACTTCNYCQWCNAHPDNHCTTCLSSRTQGKKSTAKSLATPPQPPTFPAPETAPKAQEISANNLAQAPATPSPSNR